MNPHHFYLMISRNSSSIRSYFIDVIIVRPAQFLVAKLTTLYIIRDMLTELSEHWRAAQPQKWLNLSRFCANSDKKSCPKLQDATRYIRLRPEKGRLFGLRL
jgi:hypothetical protein